MPNPHDFLKDLALVLCIAAGTTVLFQRLRQPVVFGYLIAGLIIGPHVPIPLIADQTMVETLAELGVILLMFSLGLEFTLGKLFRVGATSGLVALIEVSLMLLLGYDAAHLLGWGVRECIFAGAFVAISSTTIIAKAFAEQGVSGKQRELVFGVLIIEDLVAVLLLTTLTTMASGHLSVRTLGLTAWHLALFLAGLLAAGLLLIPRLMRLIMRLNNAETTTVASIGFSFCLALVARYFGYSVALGAFLAGSLIAESGAAPQVELLVQPVRDIFAAIFFVAVGMMIDPSIVMQHGMAILVLTVVVLVGKTVGVTLGAFLTGAGVRTSIRSGMSLAQIGEFSFLIAGLGLSLGATRGFIYPVVVSVSAVTTFLTPWMIRFSDHVATWVDRKMPSALQTFTTLYGTWVENIRQASQRSTGKSRLRRLINVTLVDMLFVAGIITGTSLAWDRLTDALEKGLHVAQFSAKALVWVGAVGVSIPFFTGMVRSARMLGQVLASTALPLTEPGQVDLAMTPRRVLIVTLQLASVLIIGIPLLVITQPFLPLAQSVGVLLLFLGVLGIVFWRRATGLQGHVQAGAQVILEALISQARHGGEDNETASTSEAIDSLAPVLHSLPGLGEPSTIYLKPTSLAIGKTLAQLNVRGLTGATVMAIKHGTKGVAVPTGHEILQVGDVLALAGTHESVQAAQQLLNATHQVDPPPIDPQPPPQPPLQPSKSQPASSWPKP